MTDWSQLETRGFAVCPGFLEESEMAVLRADFARGKPASEFPHGFKLLRPRVLHSVWGRISQVLEEIRAQTSLKADCLNHLSVSHYISTELAERSRHLHQDFDMDYRLTGDHHHMLNFWVPFEKPERARSNLTVLPWDTLPPEARQRLAGGGGCRLVPAEEGRTRILEGEEQAPVYEFDFELDRALVTPELAAGDLLVLQGDLPHRTQDVDTRRVAASIRVTYSGKSLKRQRVPQSVSASDPARPLLERLHSCFDSAQAQEITVGEFASYLQAGR